MLKKILLADDSLTIQKVVELTFTEEDYEVIVVGDGAQAIQRISQDSPDIVLADVLMPKKTGYEVCEFVKSNAATRDVPVLLLVGKFEPFDEERARKAGADGHILKPFESSVLVKRVTEFLANAARAAIARSSVGTDVTAHSEARTEAVPSGGLPAESAWSPTPAPAVAEAPVTNNTAEFEVPSGSAGFVAEPFGGVGDSPAPFDDSPKSLLDADDEEPLVPSAYVQESAFGEQAPSLAEISSASVAEAGFSDPSAGSSPVFDAAPAWEEPAADLTPAMPPASPAPSFVEETFAEPVPAYAETAGSGVASDVAMAGAGAIAMGPLSEDAVKAIVELVVRRMSTDVVRDIAWQVVPDLAELMIKKKLEELG